MTVKASLEIEIPEVSDPDYPDHQAEINADSLRRGLSDFISRVVDDNTVSEEECDVVMYAIAMHILQSFNGRAASNLLRRRLNDRMFPNACVRVSDGGGA